MATRKRQLGFFLAVALLTFQGCNDARRPEKQALRSIPTVTPRSFLTARNDVQFNGQATNILGLWNVRDRVYVTGFPNFGFAIWDFATNAEQPRLLAQAGNQLDIFTGDKPWTVDAFGSLSVTVMGSYALTSGQAGLTIINVGDPSRPRVAEYRPSPSANGEINQDVAFSCKAMVPHPTKPIFYCFREQDVVHTYGFTANGLTRLRTDSYGSGPVCCIRTAAVFRGRLFIAFGDKLVWFELNDSGFLASPGTYDELQATAVAANDRFLFVHHEPTDAQPQGRQNRQGFYVFDENGDFADFLPTNFTPQLFTVNQRSTHLMANIDSTKMQIFLINWVAQ